MSSQSRGAGPVTARWEKVRRLTDGNRRWFVVAFLGFFMLNAAWSLASPYSGAPDEYTHIVRAIGVMEGELAPTPAAAVNGSGAFQHAPLTFEPNYTACWQFQPTRSAGCAGTPKAGGPWGTVGSGAGRYNPAYYAMVGWPLRIWPDMHGVYAARLVSSALSALLLAVAAYSVVFWTRHRLMLAGLLVAVTPIAIEMNSSINPNGMEIAAATALVAVLIPMFLEPGQRLRRTPVVLAAISAAILVTLRAFGPLWFAVILGVLLVPTTRTMLTTLWRSRMIRWAGGALIVACLASVVWTVSMKVLQLGSLAHEHLSMVQAAKWEIFSRWSELAREMVGVMSWLDAPAPDGAYYLWFMCLGLVILPAVALGTRTDRWRLAALTLAMVAVPTYGDITTANTAGFPSQGRYLLPLAVGIPLLAAWTAGHRGVFDDARSASITRLVAVVVLPLQLVFLSWTMVRWQSGLGRSYTHFPVNPLSGNWHPPYGSATALAVAVIGLVLIGWFVWRTAAAPRGDAEAGIPVDYETLAVASNGAVS